MNSGNPPNVSGFRHCDPEAMENLNRPVSLTPSQGEAGPLRIDRASAEKVSLRCPSLEVVFLQLVPEGREPHAQGPGSGALIAIGLF